MPLCEKLPVPLPKFEFSVIGMVNCVPAAGRDVGGDGAARAVRWYAGG